MNTLLRIILISRKRMMWAPAALAVLLLGMSGIAGAAVTITPATGGGAIASNTAPGCSASGWTNLTGPVVREANPGEIGAGNIVLTAPAGFEFNTAAAVTILLAGNNTNTRNINDLANGSVTAVNSITASQITFTVTLVSTRANTLTWQGIQVRPTASAPLASGNITETGTSVLNGASATTNFGTLTEVTSVPVCNPAPPTVSTGNASGLGVNIATLNGTVSSNGASTTVTFDYGLTTAYGSSATATASPLAANAANAAVSAAITGLTCNTLYHYRVKGVNSAGTANGNDVTFATSACPTAVTLSKTAGTAAAAVGSYVTYTLQATNSTAAALSNVVLTDVIPASMTYITNAATLGSATLSGQTLTWTIPYLPTGANAQLTLVVQPTAKGTYTNTVQSPGAVDASADILILPTAITRYSMDEAAGSWTGAAGEVIDSGGNGLNGHRRTTTTPTATNAVAPNPTIASQHPSVVGDFCNSGRFDGNAVVESASSTFFQFSNKLSASAWIYPTAYPASDLSSILSNDVNYEFHLNPTGHLYWWWQASTLTSATVIPLNQWTHIAITMDSSLGTNSRERIYINGVLDANTNNWSGTLATNTCPFYVGGDISTGSGCALMPGRNFRGMIDEAKIYNYELSAAEVNADMNLGRFCGTTSFDHIQIEHDGTASTCAPKTVTVKACMNASCSSLYPGTVTVHLSPTGWTPSDVLTINGGVATATLSNASIVAPSLTLGTTSVSPTPVNNTRCFNGATETCTLSVGSTACSFDAAEVGANPQTHLYTKLAGKTFNVDILAVGTGNPPPVDTTKNSTVSVDLVDTSGAACSATSPALNTAQPVTLVSGRKTVAMTCATIAPSAQVRIRIGAAAPYSYACSYDKFAVRPSALTLTSTNTLAAPPPDAASATNVHTIKAGAAFNIGATTVPTGYTGALTLDTNRLSAQLPSNLSAQIAGGTVGALALAPFTVGATTYNSAIQANTVQNLNATYSEVGYFYANPGAFRDSGGTTSVDQAGQLANCFVPAPGAAPDTDTCDCLLSPKATNGNVPDYVSDTLINGRYGCYVGNNTGSAFGRFIPDHFETAIIPMSGVPMPCPAGLICPVSYNGFVYSGQPFTAQVTARNAICPPPSGACGTTQNYVSNFARDVTLSAWSGIGQVIPQNPPAGSGSLTNNTVAAGVFALGVATTAANSPVYTLPASTPPANVYISAIEANGDGITSLLAPSSSSIEGGVMVANGRIKASNAYGSELLPLRLMAAVQYYGANGWVGSTTDSVTVLKPLASPYNLLNAAGGPTGGSTVATFVAPTDPACLPYVSGTVCKDTATINLAKPTPAGTAGVATITPEIVGCATPASCYLQVIPGTATFGIYKNNNNFIYRRER